VGRLRKGASSDRDLLIRALDEGKRPGTKVRESLSKGICSAFEDDTVEHPAALMSEHQMPRLPVLDRDKRLARTVALGDFAVDSSDIQPAINALSKISEPTRA